MILLVLGLALWWGAHFFKRVAPARRAAMGDAGRGVVAGAIAVGIVFMIIGFRSAEVVNLYYPAPFLKHINNLLVLIAFYMMSPAPKRGLLLNGVRHPMLMGFSLWAFAHLLVNGELAEVVLFGGLLGWALLSMVVINRAEPGWTPGPKGTLAKDAMFLVGSVVLVAVIGYIHAWLGPWPFAS